MKKYKFTAAQLKEFFEYLTNCIMFITDKEQGTLGGLIHYHLNKLRGDFAVKILTVNIKNLKTTHVNFNYGELLTLSYCFKQWDTPPFLKGIEFNLIGAL